MPQTAVCCESLIETISTFCFAADHCLLWQLDLDHQHILFCCRPLSVVTAWLRPSAHSVLLQTDVCCESWIETVSTFCFAADRCLLWKLDWDCQHIQFCCRPMPIVKAWLRLSAHSVLLQTDACCESLIETVSTFSFAADWCPLWKLDWDCQHILFHCRQLSVMKAWLRLSAHSVLLQTDARCESLIETVSTFSFSADWCPLTALWKLDWDRQHILFCCRQLSVMKAWLRLSAHSVLLQIAVCYESLIETVSTFCFAADSCPLWKLDWNHQHILFQDSEPAALSQVGKSESLENLVQVSNQYAHLLPPQWHSWIEHPPWMRTAQGSNHQLMVQPIK